MANIKEAQIRVDTLLLDVCRAAVAFCKLPEVAEDFEAIRGSNSASYPVEFAALFEAVQALEARKVPPKEPKDILNPRQIASLAVRHHQEAARLIRLKNSGDMRNNPVFKECEEAVQRMEIELLRCGAF